MAAWYVKSASGKVQGPFAPEQIRLFVSRGRIGRAALVSRDSENWFRADEVFEFCAGVGPAHARAEEDRVRLARDVAQLVGQMARQRQQAPDAAVPNPGLDGLVDKILSWSALVILVLLLTMTCAGIDALESSYPDNGSGVSIEKPDEVRSHASTVFVRMLGLTVVALACALSVLWVRARADKLHRRIPAPAGCLGWVLAGVVAITPVMVAARLLNTNPAVGEVWREKATGKQVRIEWVGQQEEYLYGSRRFIQVESVAWTNGPDFSDGTEQHVGSRREETRVRYSGMQSLTWFVYSYEKE